MDALDGAHGRRVDYRLADAAPLRGGAARAFVVPTHAKSEDVRPGALVEILCEIVDPDEGMPRHERVWAHVTRTDGSALGGVVDNEPQVITTLARGDEISFGSRHVIRIYDAADARTVIVSRRAHVEDLRPRYVYRQPPMGPSDSGFSVMVGDESRAELDDPTALTSHAIGVLRDRWPELGPVFASRSVEAEWVWDESTQTYVPHDPPS